MNSIEEHLIKKLVESHRQKQDELLLKALQTHIPEITPANFGKYAHRLTQTSPQDKPYPIQIFLDHGTPNEILVCELQEPEYVMGHKKTNERKTKT